MSKPRAVTLTKPPPKEVMRGFLMSEEWDNAARYLRAGRQFASLTNAALERTWATAWRTYYDDYRRDLWTWCMDTEGELTLRYRMRPRHLVPPGLARRIDTRRRVDEARSDVERRLRDEVEAFMRECARAN